jgi:hypothetical protein
MTAARRGMPPRQERAGDGHGYVTWRELVGELMELMRDLNGLDERVSRLEQPATSEPEPAPEVTTADHVEAIRGLQARLDAATSECSRLRMDLRVHEHEWDAICAVADVPDGSDLDTVRAALLRHKVAAERAERAAIDEIDAAWAKRDLDAAHEQLTRTRSELDALRRETAQWREAAGEEIAAQIAADSDAARAAVDLSGLVETLLDFVRRAARGCERRERAAIEEDLARLLREAGVKG